jgi:hypothetical protein
MQDVILRPDPGCHRWLRSAALAAAMVILAQVGTGSALAQGGAANRCPGVGDLLHIAPTEEVYVDVFAYRPGVLTERLRRCRNRVSDDWFDPAEEPRRQAMGRMFEWVGAFSCAISEYATAPSVLGRPLSGPRANYLREATQLEAVSGSYDAEADLRSSAPLDHFRAPQLLVKIQSRWNKSTAADRAELVEREGRGDPYAAIALATLAFEARSGRGDVDKALALLDKATRQGSLRAPELGAEYAEVAARNAGIGARADHYRMTARAFLAAASYRGSPTAMAALVQRLRQSGSEDDADTVAFWDAQRRGITHDLQEIRNACR